MGISTVVKWFFLILLSSVHHTQAGSNYGTNSRFATVNSHYMAVNLISGAGGKCTYEVRGRGVQGTLTEACAYDSNQFDNVNSNNYHAFLFPNHYPFSLYTDTWGTLVIIQASRCRLRTYSGQVTESYLSTEVCDSIKKYLADQMVQIKEYWRKWGINFDLKMKNRPPAETIYDPLQNQPPNQPSLYSGVPGAVVSTPPQSTDADVVDPAGKRIEAKTSFPPPTNGQCQVEISVAGKGVKDTFKEPCSSAPADSVSTDNVFVFGDPRKNTISLYSNEPNTLYVIKNKVCIKNVYRHNKGVIVVIRRAERLFKCNEIKRAIVDQLTKNQPAKFALQPADSAVPQTPTATATPLATASVGTTPPTAPSGTATPDSLKQFQPTYPFKLNDYGVNSNYDMAVLKYTNDAQVCSYYITAKGMEINDHFQVSCSNERSKAISAGDFMLFGSPTSTLGLFSETPSTLVVFSKGTCYKKTYGSSPTGPTLMNTAECEEAKRRMLDRMDTNGKIINGGFKVTGDISDVYNNYDTQNSFNSFSDRGSNSGQPDINFASHVVPPIPPVTIPPVPPLPPMPQMPPMPPMPQMPPMPPMPQMPPMAARYNPSALFSSLFGPSANTALPPQPQVLGDAINKNSGNLFSVADDGHSQSESSKKDIAPTLSDTSGPLTASTTPGVSSRPGNDATYGSKVIVKVTKSHDGSKCFVEFTGRGINDKIDDSCAVLGENLKKFVKSDNTLVVADPSKKTGFYSDGWGSLVFVKDGVCYKKTYLNAYGRDTSITTDLMRDIQCTMVQFAITSALKSSAN